MPTYRGLKHIVLQGLKSYLQGVGADQRLVEATHQMSYIIYARKIYDRAPRPADRPAKESWHGAGPAGHLAANWLSWKPTSQGNVLVPEQFVGDFH